MFTHMVPIKTVIHNARNTDYELLVYKVTETNEHRIYIAKGGFGVGDIFTASNEVIEDINSLSGEDVVAGLINIAIDDIDRNEFGCY